VRRIGALVAVALVAAGCASYPRHVSFATVDADPDWSPDGRLVAFTSSRLGGGIYVVTPNGIGLRRVVRGAVSDVVWSPDGRRLAYMGPGGTYVARADGNGRRRILGRPYSLPVWAPDGGNIAVVGPDGLQRDGALWAVRPDGSRLRRLADEEGVASEGGHAAWSPGSRQIVFEVIHDRGRFVRRAMSLSVVPAVGGEIARLTYGGSAWDDPAWRDGVIGKSTF
jgi:Tol biopolymer transport system component